MTMGLLVESWKKHRQMRHALDELLAGLPEFMTVPLSSAYSSMDHLAGLLRLNRVDARLQNTIHGLFDFVTEFPEEVRLSQWVLDRNWLWHAPIIRIRRSRRWARQEALAKSREFWSPMQKLGAEAPT